MPATAQLDAMTPADRDRLRTVLRDPYVYARWVLGHDPWSIPRDILRAIAEPHASVAVKACHASSKTYTAAEAVLWFLVRYPDATVVTTAPTQTQVRDLLWKEIRKGVGGSKVVYPEPNLTELRFADGRYALGRSTDQGVRFQGFHGTVLIVIDEAPGVEDDIWEAIDGIRAGGDVRILALGNPTVSSGRFAQVFHEQRAGWQTFTISAFDTPNLQGLDLPALLALPEDDLDINPRPYLVTRRWVRDRYDEWGTDSPQWQSRVMGNFPRQSRDALLSLDWLEAAQQRPYADIHPDSARFVAGLDVAGPGSAETVLYVRQGPNVVYMGAWASSDPRGYVIDALRLFEPDVTVYVDEVGIGYNMYLHIRDVLNDRHSARLAALGLPQHSTAIPTPMVRGVNVGDRPADPERFANLKAELYWGLRKRFQDGDVAGLTDERTIAQLAGIRTLPNPRGQNTIEKKEDAARRGVPSPDRAEAFMLCFTGKVGSGSGLRVLTW